MRNRPIGKKQIPHGTLSEELQFLKRYIDLTYVNVC